MQPYLFREEDRPKFKVTYAGLFAMILLLLLMGFVERHDPFRLNPEELARIKKEEAEKKREMVFRFSDAPDEDIEKDDARFQSDANREQRSQQTEKSPNQDPDPFSKGNTYELQNRQAPSPNQAAQATPPSPQQTPQKPKPSQNSDQPQAQNPKKAEAKEQKKPIEKEVKEATREEPDKPEQREVEDKVSEKLDQTQGKLPILPGAPKPYRPMSAKDLAAAREAAIREMDISQASQGAAPGSNDSASFDNPTGSNAPFLGLTVETTRSDLGPYLKVLKQLISGNWRVPNIARFEVRGVTGISFNIHKDGSFSDVRILLASGYEPLDVSSLNAINNTNPAPPLPKFVDEEKVPIRFGFYYNMRPNY